MNSGNFIQKSRGGHAHIFDGEGSISLTRFLKGSVAHRGLTTVHFRTFGLSVEFWEPLFGSATDLE